MANFLWDRLNGQQKPEEPRLPQGAGSRPPPNLRAWEIPPAGMRTVADLMTYGLGAYVEGLGIELIQAGWALWHLDPLSDATWGYIYDGYRRWKPTVPVTEGLDFILAVFERLEHSDAEFTADTNVWSLPDSVAAPAARRLASRSFAGTEYIQVARAAGLSNAEVETRIFGALCATPVAFVPGRACSVFESLAAERR